MKNFVFLSTVLIHLLQHNLPIYGPMHKNGYPLHLTKGYPPQNLMICYASAFASATAFALAATSFSCTSFGACSYLANSYL